MQHKIATQALEKPARGNIFEKWYYYIAFCMFRDNFKEKCPVRGIKILFSLIWLYPWIWKHFIRHGCGTYHGSLGM